MKATGCCSGASRSNPVRAVLAANRKEQLICELLEHASKRLDDRELMALLSQTAVGLFFREAPMCNFGLTPIAYFAARKLRRPLLLLFATREVDRLLNLASPEEMRAEMAKHRLEPPLLARELTNCTEIVTSGGIAPLVRLYVGGRVSVREIVCHLGCLVKLYARQAALTFTRASTPLVLADHPPWPAPPCDEASAWRKLLPTQTLP